MTWKLIASINRRHGPYMISISYNDVQLDFVNFRVTKGHAGPFTNPRESVAVIVVSKHGTRTLVQPRGLFFIWMANPGPEVSADVWVLPYICSNH